MTKTNWTAWIAHAHGLDDAAWARHANPWSGWTRLPIAPLLILAIWSRIWIGAWCLVPVALLLLWTAINPYAFPAPRDTTSWMSRAVFGERVFLARDRRPIPAQHRAWANGLTLAALPGVALCIWGVAALEPWPALFGLTVAMAAKLWFLDRMVWLYEDMAAVHPDYAAWRHGGAREEVTGTSSGPISTP
ncbi:MAG: DUF6653 family protein [Paracoccaceae bacterium]